MSGRTGSGAAGRRRARHAQGGGHSEGGSSERWLVSYADFITLLFAFFVVMFAISQADLRKFREVAEGMKRAFDGSPSGGQSGSHSGSSRGDFGASPFGATPGDRDISPQFASNTGVRSASGGAGAESAVAPEAGSDPELLEIQKLLQEAVRMDEALLHSAEITIQKNGNQTSLHWIVQDSYPEGTSAVPRDYQPLLGRVARVLSRFPSRRIRLEGHADGGEGAPGSQAAWTLGFERAWNIGAYLIGQGVEPSRLEVTSRGSAELLKQEATRWARARNRRVVLRISNWHP